MAPQALTIFYEELKSLTVDHSSLNLLFFTPQREPPSRALGIFY